MDTSSWVLIGLAAAGGIGTIARLFVGKIIVNLEANRLALNGKAKQEDLDTLKQIIADFKVDVERSHAKNEKAIGERAMQIDVDALDHKLSDFQVEAVKSFVSQPALLQIMSSLDRTIQQLTQAIQHNSQESRDGMSALNKRIDDLMNKRGP